MYEPPVRKAVARDAARSVGEHGPVGRHGKARGISWAIWEFRAPAGYFAQFRFAIHRNSSVYSA